MLQRKNMSTGIKEKVAELSDKNTSNNVLNSTQFVKRQLPTLEQE